MSKKASKPLSLSEKTYNPEHRFEKMTTVVFEQSHEGSLAVAKEIADLIRAKKKQGKKCVLGLATGSSPVTVYAELVRMHKKEGLSFKNVITFNLDEYFPMDPKALQSYVRFMNEHLFDHIDIDRKNVHIPDGTIAKEDVIAFCRDYEKKILAVGGVDLQLLGIGRTGHIGFNEPGSDLNSPTRAITLDRITRIDAANDFFSEEFVPRRAITMGVGTIMRAKRIVLMAWGEGKAPIIQKTVEGEIIDTVPATYLQKHPNTTVILDSASAAELTRNKTPWLVKSCTWDTALTRKAVTWLSLKINKPILKLTDREYNEHGMSDLITEHNHAYDININVFNLLQHTITGWPGGKPHADDTYRPERAKPAKKRVIIFSPHPDDDVISMGGTFHRLVEQGHEVHVAYQTSGNIAVFDDYVVQVADLFKEFSVTEKKLSGGADGIYLKVLKDIKSKKPGDIDSRLVANLKAIIRRSEARAGARYVGIPDSHTHFLDLPFYETGTVKKKPLGPEDIRIIANLLEKIKPHQIYAAGDLSDPHGTHRVSLEAVFRAVDKVKKDAWFKDCYIWLYRGAWQEWSIDEIEMAVPISPEELMKKRKAIFKHQSQKDSALFPGQDAREFWQRAEDRNRNTAMLYDKLGFAEYEAMEAFKRHYV